MKYLSNYFKFNENSEYVIYKTELEKYVDYFKRYWLVHVIEVPFDLEGFKKNKSLGYLLGNKGNELKILISISNNNLLVHIYYKENSYNISNKDELTLVVLRTTALFDMLEASQQVGLTVSLKLCGDIDKDISIKTINDPNILDNLFSNVSFTNDNDWFNTIPYFIHFGDSNSIKNWWNGLFLDKNPNQIYKVINKIGANEKEFNKFKQITGYDPANLDSASDMGEMGF